MIGFNIYRATHQAVSGFLYHTLYVCMYVCMYVCVWLCVGREVDGGGDCGGSGRVWHPAVVSSPLHTSNERISSTQTCGSDMTDMDQRLCLIQYGFEP